MSPVHLKSWVHQLHLPSGHNMRIGMGHMVHDERFWALVVAVGIIAILIAIAIWVGLTGEGTGPDFLPIDRFYPYNY